MKTRDWNEAEDIITVSLLFEWRRMLTSAPHGKKREQQDRFCQHIISVRPEFHNRNPNAVRQHFLLFYRITREDIDYEKIHDKHKGFYGIHTGLEDINS